MRITDKERLNRTIEYSEKQKRLEFLLKFNIKTLVKLAIKLGVLDVPNYSEKQRNKLARTLATKTNNIQDYWRILIYD